MGRCRQAGWRPCSNRLPGVARRALGHEADELREVRLGDGGAVGGVVGEDELGARGGLAHRAHVLEQQRELGEDDALVARVAVAEGAEEGEGGLAHGAWR